MANSATRVLPAPVGAELAAEVGVLLVGERLQWRGVRDAAAAVERGVDGELGDEGLAGAGGRGDDHRLAVEDRVDGPELERVEWKRVAGLERLQQLLRHVRGTSPPAPSRYHGLARSRSPE